MPVAIKGSGGGSVTLTAGAAAADTTLTLPNTTGTVALTASPTFSGTTTVTTLTATTITSPASTALTFQYGGTTGATLNTSGQLLVGTTTAFDNVSSLTVQSLGGVATKIAGTTLTSQMSFFNDNGRVGYIGTSGTTTSYNTSSDYRLKENIAPMTTGLATISALKPVTYDWISDKSAGEGFIAHEIQEIIPHAVSGEKDAVNEDGSIRSQGVDYSKIVVHLVAAIQELTTRLAALEAK